LTWVFLGFLIALTVLAWRLGEIQIRQHAVYALAKLNQNTVEVPLEPVRRGLILDRNFHDLTGRHIAFRIVVIPQLIEKPERVVAGLSEIMGVETGEIRRHLEIPGILPYTVSRVQKASILTQGWMGVGVLPVTFRYGERPLAVHTVGHLGPSLPGNNGHLTDLNRLGYEPDEPVGKTGIELLYETELRGSSPNAVVQAFLDARGHPLSGLGLVVEAGMADDGRRNVRLTLDLRVQQTVEEIMDREIESGAVVVMDIATGDILALASRPDYHPGRVGVYLDSGVADIFNNQALALYQPGSIFKIAVAAAALEEGLVNPESTFVCSGHRDKLVQCWLAEGHGELDFAEAFACSCNPVFARIVCQLGSRKLVEYAQRFRLDQQVVIGFNVARDRRQDFSLIERPFNLVNAGIGQGPVLLNPVQITSLVAATGREGVHITPRLVIETRHRGQTMRTFKPGMPERIMSVETAQTLAEMMKLVTTDGQGTKALVSGWGSAGKTGTAQAGGGINNAWFSGYFPVAQPRYAVTVLVRGGKSGGETAAPIFRAIAEQIMTEVSLSTVLTAE
jgi:penicillin-binding protein 2